MAKPLTLKQFQKKFSTDDACLEHLFRIRYGAEVVCPKCGQIDTFHRLKKLPAYTCNCGHHIHPMAGTPFQSTRTPLTTWFHVMFLFCASRNGVSAKEVQRQIGVTYKTAWRMCNEIRRYMGWVDGDAPLGGPQIPVEADKAYIGGVDRKGQDDKAIVLGMQERGGEIITRVVADKTQKEVTPHIERNVLPGSRLMTDEGGAFGAVYHLPVTHETVNHSQGEYVRDDVHTNSVEGYFSIFKRGMMGIYQHCSEKHLHRYLSEFDFRYSNREKMGVNDLARTDRAIRGIVGKRLTYRTIDSWPEALQPQKQSPEPQAEA